jgi:amidase
MNIPPHYLGAAELARRISRGEISSRELVDTMLERIRRLNPEVNAVVLTREPEARERAREADAARRTGDSWGPLHGVPITVKECFDWSGTPSTFGRPDRRQHRAVQDAVALSRLVAAGAIVLGKTNVPLDLADWQSFNEVYGVTRNPWALDRSPGGSSGGAAAALAAGFSALEIGSDVGGSIRMPAHFCGVYGHRPTFGVVPVQGHALSPDLPPDDINAVGPLARTAEDLGLAFRLMAGPHGAQARAWRFEPPPCARASLAAFRVAVVTGDADFPVDRDTRQAALGVADVLRAQDAAVTLDPGLPVSSRDYYRLYIALLRASTSFRRSLREIEALVPGAAALDAADDGYNALMLRGLTQLHREWLERNAERQRLRARWEQFFAHYDVLIAPVSPTPAFPHMHDVAKPAQRLDVDGLSRPNADTYFWIGLAAAAGLPATTIPAGRSGSGLPIGLQIIGREFDDLTCIEIARQLETCHRAFEPPPKYAAAIPA